MQIWGEVRILDGLVMREDRDVIPQADLGEYVGNLRQGVIELAHYGHVGGQSSIAPHQQTRVDSWDGRDDRNQDMLTLSFS